MTTLYHSLFKLKRNLEFYLEIQLSWKQIITTNISFADQKDPPMKFELVVELDDCPKYGITKPASGLVN